MERNYIAFISYRHKPLDIAAARRIHRMIERYTIPRELRALRGGKKRLGIVFRDQDELAAASDLTEELRRALDHSEFLVVICTPDTLDSHWVNEEIRYFLSNPRHDRRHVLAVLADGEPEQSFPAVLTWDEAEGRSVDPLAADLRSKGSGSRRECRRLLAPMVGCGYDDLVQRERRRRMLRLTAGIAAALAVSIGFSSVLLLQNRQIDAQKQEVQLRESQLLAKQAADLYEDGRLYEAIDSAIQALPNPENAARPYYAPAESILMETENIFSLWGTDAYMTETVIDQPTPIANLCFSRDGSQIVTIGDYGELRCFDTARGRPQWTATVASDRYHTQMPQLLIREPQGNLLCASDNRLYSLSMSTGEILWERQLENEYFIYDRREDRIACVESIRDFDTGKRNLSVMLLCAQTGQVQKSIPIGAVDFFSSCLFTGGILQSQLPAGGTFSEDGRYYAGIFVEDSYEDEKPVLCFFVADLEQEIGNIFLRQELDYGYGYNAIGMEMRGDDLYLALSVPDREVAAMVMRVNWRDGSVRWQMCTPKELDVFLSTFSGASFAIFDETSLTVAAGNGIYAIDLETGEILAAALLSAGITELQSVSEFTLNIHLGIHDDMSLTAAGDGVNIIDLETEEILDSTLLSGRLNKLQPVGKFAMGISLENGSYFLVWRNSNGFHFSNDSSLQLEADVGEHHYAKLFGDGILHSKTGGDSLLFSLAFEGSSGSLATVNVGNQNRLLIHKPIIRKQTIAYSPIDLPDIRRSFNSDMDAVFCPNGRLILGPLVGPEDEDTCLYALIDPETHTVEKILEAEEPKTNSGTFNWLLPDASGYIRQEEKGSLALVRDGKRTVLAEEGEDDHSTAIGVYLSDGSVLNARANDRTMTLWQNGQQTVSCALPEEQIIAPDMYSVSRLLKAGANGCILVGVYKWEEPVAVNSLAVYDRARDRWSSLSGEATLPNPDAVAFAQKQSLLAFADGENTLCVWDLNRGETVCQIPTVINPNSIAFMGFLLDDTHLVIKTEDSLLLYDISTGELNYQEKFNGLIGRTLRAYEDQKNQRLYLIDGECDTGTNGICLDLRSWTKLGEGSGMICFDVNTGELYRLDSSYWTSDPLKYACIPGTDELIRLGQELLNGQ